MYANQVEEPDHSSVVKICGSGAVSNGFNSRQ